MKISEIRAVNENKIRSSFQWLKLVYPKLVILSPTGWDKKDFEYSFYREMVSLEEFENRLAVSTVLHNTDYLAR